MEKKDWREDMDFFIKENLWAWICPDCNGGGADGQKKCKKCSGRGVYDWETELLLNRVEQELEKAREEGFTKEELETILYWSEIVEQYNYNLPKEERKLLKKIKSKLTTK